MLMLYEDTRVRAKTDSGTDTKIDGDNLTELIMFPELTNLKVVKILSPFCFSASL